VEFGGVGELHAAFLTESRTRGHVRCSVQEIRFCLWTIAKDAQDSVLGYSQPSPFDKLRADFYGTQLGEVVLTQTLATPDGREELLNEYLCDYPDCTNIASR
jgi:hypothetical protein